MPAPPKLTIDHATLAYHAYDWGYNDGWDGKDPRPRPSYTPLERVCYRAGYADGSGDRHEGAESAEAAYDRELVDLPSLADEDEVEDAYDNARYAERVCREGAYRRSYDAPWWW